MTKISTNHCTTKNAFSKALIVILALVLLFASYTVATEIDRARAEEITTPGFILCKSYVVIRQWASKRATEIGQLDPAEQIEIDGRTKDGFAHIVAPCDGWVWAGYITFSKPQKIDAPAVVTAKKRVAARRWCDGPNVDSKPWLISGSEVRIYWICDDWALTNRGYVKSEWLEVCAP